MNHEVVNQSCRKEKARLDGIENVKIRLLVRFRHGSFGEETGWLFGPGKSGRTSIGRPHNGEFVVLDGEVDEEVLR